MFNIIGTYKPWELLKMGIISCQRVWTVKLTIGGVDSALVLETSWSINFTFDIVE